jgi:hypothetical protein
VAGNLGESLNSMGICKFIGMSECGQLYGKWFPKG